MKPRERSVIVMAEISDMKMPISNLTKNIQCTITLTGTTAFNIRNSVGMWFIRLGARVMAVDVRLDMAGRSPDDSILIGEIRGLRNELKEGIYQTAKMTKQIKRQMDRWDCGGVPETRTPER